ncbi:hypothetical protein HYR99_39235 [Candidatus Poribacteria bacterium]|nr:hypothetical protein [Candidatus Poribacteria bacterium]
MKRFLQVIFFNVLLPISVFGQGAPADFILLNGKVFTGDSAQPFAQAVAIRGERIIAVGTSAEIETLAGVKTQRIDLQGRMVVPGFNDAHFHFMPDPQGFHLQFKTLAIQNVGAEGPSWAEIVEAIEAAV